MRRQTAALLFGAAAATGAAAIGAVTARLFAADADERHRRAYHAIAELALRMPPPGADLPGCGQRPELVLIRSECTRQ